MAWRLETDKKCEAPDEAKRKWHIFNPVVSLFFPFPTRNSKKLFTCFVVVVFYFYMLLFCKVDLHYCERFEPRSHFKSRLSLIVLVNVVLNRTVVVESDWRFDNLCGSHLQSQSELYHISWWYYTLVIDLIGQLRRDVVGRLSVKPWCYSGLRSPRRSNSTYF